jgi:hypothetical protein
MNKVSNKGRKEWREGVTERRKDGMEGGKAIDGRKEGGKEGRESLCLINTI